MSRVDAAHSASVGKMFEHHAVTSECPNLPWWTWASYKDCYLVLYEGKETWGSRVNTTEPIWQATVALHRTAFSWLLGRKHLFSRLWKEKSNNCSVTINSSSGWHQSRSKTYNEPNRANLAKFFITVTWAFLVRSRQNLASGMLWFYCPFTGAPEGFLHWYGKTQAGGPGVLPRKNFEIYSCSTTQILILSVQCWRYLSSQLYDCWKGLLPFIFFLWWTSLYGCVSLRRCYNDMIVAPLLRWKCIKTAAKDDPSRPLDKGTVPELVDIQLIPPPFFSMLWIFHDKQTTLDKPRENDKQSSNETDVYFFFFCF